MADAQPTKRARVSKKLIIDTDPGVDDTMAIFLAFASPEVEVIGLTTIFGNVRTPTATRNALYLCEMADRAHIPVAEGAKCQLRGGVKERIASFVHGDDGLGNTGEATPTGTAVEEDAADFMIRCCRDNQGEVTILALGPMTNVALAIQRDSAFVNNVQHIVTLAGAFFCNGNVNPAAEANVFGDPDAADLVFTSGANISCIGLDVTQQTLLTREQLDACAEKGGRLCKYLHSIAQFYIDYHFSSYKKHSMYLHDPAAMTAVVRPELFTWREGAVRVVTEGITRGQTVMDHGDKNWVGVNDWSKAPKIKVCLEVHSEKLLDFVCSRIQSV